MSTDTKHPKASRKPRAKKVEHAPEKKVVKVVSVVWDEAAARFDRDENRWMVVDEEAAEQDKVKAFGTIKIIMRWCKDRDVAFKVLGANRGLRRRFAQAGVLIEPGVIYYHGAAGK